MKDQKNKTFLFKVTESENVYIHPDPEWTESYRIEQSFNIVFNKSILGALIVKSYDEEVLKESMRISKNISKVVDTLRTSEILGFVEIDGTKEDMDTISKYAIEYWEDSKLTYDDIQTKIKKIEKEGGTVPDIIRDYKKPSPEHYRYLDKNLEACKKILSTIKEK